MKNVLKWIGVLFGALILIALLYGGYVYWKAGSLMSQTYPEIQGKNIYVPSDSALIARGEHLMKSSLGCTGCHSENLGGESVDMMPLAMFNVPNLTPGVGGLPKEYTIQEFDLAVRHGIMRDKRGVIVMPVYHYQYIADEDIGAMYAYLMQAPKINRNIEPLKLGPIGNLLVVQRAFDIMPAVVDHNFKSTPRPEIAPDAAYGKYLANIACIGCHAPNLSGGPVYGGDPNWPPAANLTTKLKTYTHESFTAFIKTGIRPDGTIVDTTAMPIKEVKNIDSLETAALWNYLSTLAPQPDASADWPSILKK